MKAGGGLTSSRLQIWTLTRGSAIVRIHRASVIRVAAAVLRMKRFVNNSIRFGLATWLAVATMLPSIVIVHAHAEGSKSHRLLVHGEPSPVCCGLPGSALTVMQSFERHAHILLFGAEVHVALPEDSSEPLPQQVELAFATAEFNAIDAQTVTSPAGDGVGALAPSMALLPPPYASSLKPVDTSGFSGLSGRDLLAQFQRLLI